MTTFTATQRDLLRQAQAEDWPTGALLVVLRRVRRGEDPFHACVTCHRRDRGQRDWGLDHAQTCGGFVPRPVGWHTSPVTTSRNEPPS